MSESEKNTSEKNGPLSFIKVDQIRRGTLGLQLLLRPDDIIVAVDKEIFKGGQKVLNQILKEKEKTILTIQRKNIFFNILVPGPLGLGLVEVASDEDELLLSNTKEYLRKINNFDNYNEYEVYKGEKNKYNEIKVTEISLMASFFPFIWFFHHKLFMPLILLAGTLLLLGSIAWWLFLTAWVIITIYMSKSSMTLLRSYCLFNEMKIYMRMFASSNVEVQETIRKIDKKSNYVFPLIEPPLIDDKEDQGLSKSSDTMEAASSQA